MYLKWTQRNKRVPERGTSFTYTMRGTRKKKNRDSYKTISKYLLNTHKPENIKHIFLNRESQFLILNFISIIVEYILELRT